MTPNRLTSMGRDSNVDDMSTTSGASDTCGTLWNSTPNTVSFGV
jgi:hypothetical protein